MKVTLIGFPASEMRIMKCGTTIGTIIPVGNCSIKAVVVIKIVSAQERLAD